MTCIRCDPDKIFNSCNLIVVGAISVAIGLLSYYAIINGISGMAQGLLIGIGCSIIAGLILFKFHEHYKKNTILSPQDDS